MDNFLQKLKKVVRIMLYGLAISQLDCRKAGQYQLPLLNTNIHARVTYNGFLSRDFVISQDSEQGRISAPFMYKVYINLILDGVRDGGGGAKSPQFNFAIWGLTTMKLGRNRAKAQNFSKQQQTLVTS